ncbi:TPA: hypothetical protein ACT2H7_001072 [Streptococcus suis]|uniref:hypothetical protein n=1 Tax=Streptococcus suis TaxID=1307 RepID=UPI0007690BE5|nr:hypothetical protein [Streptococcus suis]MDW8719464.1 hypothetical protein [Streptococcus suis]WNF78055.1 hypothetical protein RJW55_01505 [Streptococcus suis]CYU78375.1 Uncharacterised protein [Streptococcus suis]CYV30159.1 Uncharacterised protein [Streptococcus suis]
MEKENIRMRLATESKLILDELQRLILEEIGLEASYSSIVSQAVRKTVPKMHEIDWQSIKNKSLSLSSPKQSNDWEYQTSFMLEKDVLELISELQVYFLEVFQAKRIHRAFCVRLCLKVHYLLLIS